MTQDVSLEQYAMDGFSKHLDRVVYDAAMVHVYPGMGIARGREAIAVLLRHHEPIDFDALPRCEATDALRDVTGLLGRLYDAYGALEAAPSLDRLQAIKGLVVTIRQAILPFEQAVADARRDDPRHRIVETASEVHEDAVYK